MSDRKLQIMQKTKIISGILIIFFLTSMLMFTSCYTPGTISIIYSADYNNKEKLTKYDKYPFGQVKIPGNWILENYDPVNRTHFYRDSAQVYLGIGMVFCNQTPFYQKDMSDSLFLREYYEWDSKYWIEKIGASARIIEKDTINNTLLWNLKDDKNLNSFYLYGTKYHRAFYFLVSTDKWSDSEKINFLKTLYSNTEIYNCCENYY